MTAHAAAAASRRRCVLDDIYTFDVLLDEVVHPPLWRVLELNLMALSAVVTAMVVTACFQLRRTRAREVASAQDDEHELSKKSGYDLNPNAAAQAAFPVGQKEEVRAASA